MGYDIDDGRDDAPDQEEQPARYAASIEMPRYQPRMDRLNAGAIINTGWQRDKRDLIQAQAREDEQQRVVQERHQKAIEKAQVDEATQARREHNAKMRQAAVATGQKFSEDAGGYLQPVNDPASGKPLFSEGSWKPVRREGAQWVEERRNQFGEREEQRKDAELVASKALDDKKIYVKTPTGLQELGDEDGLLDADDERVRNFAADRAHKREMRVLNLERAKTSAERRTILSELHRLEGLKDGQDIDPMQVDSWRLDAEKFSKPNPAPEPKGIFFGMGPSAGSVSQEDQDAWDKKESKRKADLQSVQAKIGLFEKARELGDRFNDLNQRQADYAAAGVDGFWQRRQTAEVDRRSGLSVEEGRKEAEARIQAVNEAGQSLQSEKQALDEEAAALLVQGQRGLSGAEMAGFEQLRNAHLEKQAAFNQKVGEVNAEVGRISEMEKGFQARQKEESRSQREPFRKDADFAPLMDRLDVLDAEEESRGAEVEAMQDGPAKDAARNALRQDLETKRGEISGQFDTIRQQRKADRERLAANEDRRRQVRQILDLQNLTGESDPAVPDAGQQALMDERARLLEDLKDERSDFFAPAETKAKHKRVREINDALQKPLDIKPGLELTSPIGRGAQDVDYLTKLPERQKQLETLKKKFTPEEYQTYLKDTEATDWTKNKTGFAKLSDGEFRFSPEALSNRAAFEKMVAQAVASGRMDEQAKTRALESFGEIEGQRREAQLKIAQGTDSYQRFRAQPKFNGRPEDEIFDEYLNSAGMADWLKGNLNAIGNGAASYVQMMAAGGMLELSSFMGGNQEKAAAEMARVLNESLSQKPVSGDVRIEGTMGSTIGQFAPQIALQLLVALAFKKAGVSGLGAAVGTQAIQGLTAGFQIGAENYSKVYDANVKEHGEERAHEMAMQAFKENLPVGFTENIPIEMILSKLPKGKVMSVVKMLGDAAGEVGQEWVQNKLSDAINQKASAEYVMPEGMSLQQMLEMGAGTMAVSGFLGGARRMAGRSEKTPSPTPQGQRGWDAPIGLLWADRAAPIRPEEVAAAEAEIKAAQPARQALARGMVKIAQGAPYETLTAEERAAVETPGPDGVARVEEVNGQRVVTDNALRELSNEFPETAKLFRLSETEARERAVNPKSETSPPEASATGRGANAEPAAQAVGGEAAPPASTPGGDSATADAPNVASPATGESPRHTRGSLSALPLEALREIAADMGVNTSVEPGEPALGGAELADRILAAQDERETATKTDVWTARGRDGTEVSIPASEAKTEERAKVKLAVALAKVSRKAGKTVELLDADSVEFVESVDRKETSTNEKQKARPENVQSVSGVASTETPVLQDVSRKMDAGVAEGSSLDARTASEIQREDNGSRVSGQGQNQTKAVPGVREGEGGNAPRGSRQAAGSDVAVPGMSSDPASVRGGNAGNEASGQQGSGAQTHSPAPTNRQRWAGVEAPKRARIISKILQNKGVTPEAADAFARKWEENHAGDDRGMDAVREAVFRDFRAAGGRFRGERAAANFNPDPAYWENEGGQTPEQARESAANARASREADDAAADAANAELAGKILDSVSENQEGAYGSNRAEAGDRRGVDGHARGRVDREAGGSVPGGTHPEGDPASGQTGASSQNPVDDGGNGDRAGGRGVSNGNSPVVPETAPNPGSPADVDSAVSRMARQIAALNARFGLTGKRAIQFVQSAQRSTPFLSKEALDAGEIRIVWNLDESLAQMKVRAESFGGDGVRWFEDALNEELTHAADRLEAREAWEKEGRPGTLGEFARKRRQAGLNALDAMMARGDKDGRTVAEALLSAVLTYQGGGAGDLRALAEKIPGNDPVAKARELVRLSRNGELTNSQGNPFWDHALASEFLRMVIQARRRGEITETGFQAATRRIVEWIRGVADKLRAAGDVPIVRDQIRRMEELLAAAEDLESGAARPVEVGNASITPPGEVDLGTAAFHGSPHHVDRFSVDKIGSGEGAQVYGWGLYFAENLAVAETYRNNLSFKDTKRKFLADLDQDAGTEEVMAAVGTGQFTPYQERVLKALEADDWLGFDYPAQAISAAYGNLENYDASQELLDAVAGSGNTYTVELDVEESDLLDWDKPLSEQSEKVREALENAGEGFKKYGKSPHTSSGGWFYIEIAERIGDEKAASEYLRSLGIPGIRYLDQGSRGYIDIRPLGEEGYGAGKYGIYRGGVQTGALYASEAEAAEAASKMQQNATYNYVIFDESKIKITERNGNRIPVSDAVAVQSDLQSAAVASPGDLVRDNLGLATTIANDYRNIPGVELDDVIQQARLALVKAARGYPQKERAMPFKDYAGRSIRNELNTFYGRQIRTAEREVDSLDRPLEEGGTVGARFTGQTAANVTGPIERRETESLLSREIARLPERPAAIVRGFMNGLSGEEIGERLGISRQAVNGSLRGALGVLRKRLREQGIEGHEEGALYAAAMPDGQRDYALGSLDAIERQVFQNDEPDLASSSLPEDDTTRRAARMQVGLSRLAESDLEPPFREAMEKDGADGYPGLEGLTPSKGLTREERAVEAHFAQMIAADPEGFAERYRALAEKETGHDGYVNADMARDLYPPYQGNKEMRAFLERATIAPAGYVALNLAWNDALRRSEFDPRSEAFFVAGGMASGKSTRAVRTPDVQKGAAVIYDSVLGNYDRAKTAIQQALDAGLFPRVIFVWRPFGKAVDGMIDRMVSEGRPVSVRSMADGHFNAQQVFLRLADEFSGDGRVGFDIRKNFYPGDTRSVPVDELRAASYGSSDGNTSDSGETQAQGQEEPAAVSQGVRRSPGEGQPGSPDSAGREAAPDTLSLSGSEAERKAQMAAFAARKVQAAYESGQITAAQARAALYGSSTARPAEESDLSSASFDNRGLEGFLNRGVRTVLEKSVADPAKWTGEKIAAALAGTTVGELSKAAWHSLKGQWAPQGHLPAEVAALIREARIALSYGGKLATEWANLLHRGGESSLLGFQVSERMDTPENRKAMWEALTGERKMETLPRELQPVAKKVRRIIDNLGKRAVEAGLLDKETYERGAGHYLPRLYTPKELEDGGILGLARRVSRMNMDRFKPRLSDAFAILNSRGEPITHDGKKWRFDNAHQRDVFYAQLMAREVAKAVRAQGGAAGLTPGDVTNPDRLPTGLRERIAKAKARFMESHQKNDPWDEKTLDRMGHIKEAAYPVGKAILQLSHDIAMANLFRQLAGNSQWVREEGAAGYTQMSDDPRWGALSGKWVRDDIVDKVNETRDASHVAFKTYDFLLSHWKKWKTVYNPATHGRNLIGNILFADLAGVSWHDPRNWKYYARMAETLRGKNPAVPLAQLWEDGIMSGDWTAQELKNILLGADLKKPEHIMAKIWTNTVGRAGQKAQKLYQLEDQIFKVAAYLKCLDHSMTRKEAAAHVRKWFPDYGEVPGSTSVKAARRISPFLSFFYEAIRIAGVAAQEKPATLAKWAAIPALMTLYSLNRLGIDDDDDKDAVLEAMRGKLFGFPVFSALMPWKDNQGRLVQFDLTNIIPYAQPLGLRLDREGERNTLWQDFTLMLITSNPVGNLLTGAAFNQDAFTGKELEVAGMTDAERWGTRANFAYKTIAPPLAPPIPGTGIEGGSTIQTLMAPDRTRGSLQKRDRGQAAIRGLAGMDFRSAQPSVWNAIERFQKEQGYSDRPKRFGETAAGRSTKRLYEALINEDTEGVARELNYLTTEEKIPLRTVAEVRRFIMARHPYLGPVKKEDAPAFLQSLSPVERESLDREMEEFRHVLHEAPTRLNEARELLVSP